MVSFAWLEPLTGNLDEFFAYRTNRTVAIRDRRLGISLLLLQLSIAGYVLVYQVILGQSYLAASDLVGSVRLQMLAPSDAYRWGGGRAPYCANVTALDGPRAADYVIRDGAYAFAPGGAADGATFFPQRPCTFYDATSAIPLAETDRVFLTSEERTTVQAVNASAECDAAAAATLSSPACVFVPPYSKSNPRVTQRAFVADVEFFTLLVDHSMSAPLAGLAFTSKQMAGRLLDAKGKVLDACAAYDAFGPGACPDFIAVGVAGAPDIVSIRTLMEAAGVASLDVPSGTDDPDDETVTSSREAGIVLVLDISYVRRLRANSRRTVATPTPYTRHATTTPTPCTRRTTATLTPCARAPPSPRPRRAISTSRARPSRSAAARSRRRASRTRTRSRPCPIPSTSS